MKIIAFEYDSANPKDLKVQVAVDVESGEDAQQALLDARAWIAEQTKDVKKDNHVEEIKELKGKLDEVFAKYGLGEIGATDSEQPEPTESDTTPADEPREAGDNNNADTTTITAANE